MASRLFPGACWILLVACGSSTPDTPGDASGDAAADASVDAPPALLVAKPIDVTTNVGVSVDVDVLGGSSAPDAQITTTSKPAYGTATIHDGLVTYTPKPTFVGMDSFTYQITRGGVLASSIVRVTSRCAGHPAPELSYEHQKTTLRVNLQVLRPLATTFALARGYLDVDHDGLEDVFIAPGDGTQSTTPVEMYRSTGGGFMRDQATFGANVAAMVHPRKALVSDLNGDGVADIFVVAHGYDQPPWPGEAPVALLANGATFVEAPGLDAFSGYHHGGATADIDNDGDVDVFLTFNYLGKSYFLMNDGHGTFTLDDTRLSSDLFNKSYFTAELVDVDQDCNADLLLAGHEQDGAPTYILWGDSSGTFATTRSTLLPGVADHGVVTDVDAEDLDGDGDRDVVVTRTGSTSFYQGYYLQAIENQGSRAFVDATSAWLPTGQDAAATWIDWIHLQDVNGDGAIDIVVDDAARDLVWLDDGAGHMTKQ